MNNYSSLFNYKKSTFIVYILSIVLITGAVISLPFLSTTVSVKTIGIIRPISGRTEIQALQSGLIDSLFFSDGDRIKKGEVILKVKDFTSDAKLIFNKTEADRRYVFIKDLKVLTGVSHLSDETAGKLATSL